MNKKSILLNKTLVIGIIILFIGMFVNPSTGSIINEKSIKPISDGNTLYVGGFGPGNYTQIQDAIDNANNGDTVFVYDDSSPYYENLIVTKSINLIGEDRSTTVINGSGNPSLSAVNISSENVILSGFTIQKYRNKNYTYDDYVIKIQSDYNIISGNILTGNITYGIGIRNSQYNNISINVITNNLTVGMFLFYSNYTKISNNHISTLLAGILLQNSNNNDITSNFISNCNVGVYLAITRNNSINRNIIINNVVGIFSEGFSTNNKINRNNISYNKYYGAFISNPLEDEVTQNNFIGNKDNAYFLNNLRLAFRGKDLTGIDPYFPKIFWNSNYWDEPRLQSYIIPGFITFLGLNFFIRYFFKIYLKGSEIEIMPFPINWFNIDKNPAKEPYDI